MQDISKTGTFITPTAEHRKAELSALSWQTYTLISWIKFMKGITLKKFDKGKERKRTKQAVSLEGKRHRILKKLKSGKRQK